MSETIDERLAALGIELSAPPAALAKYVPVYQDGLLLYVSGQIPLKDGAVVYKGRLGAELDVETGAAAARLCAINILAQLKAHLGDLGQVERCLRLGGFVASTPEFGDHPAVVNGASELMVEVFGEAGRHVRAAVGCSSLPLQSAVEVEGLFRVRA